MNKRAMEQMQTKFPNHKVLSMSEDGLNVALLDASGNLFGYTFNADDNGEVIASKIMPCAAHIVLSVGEVELNAPVVHRALHGGVLSFGAQNGHLALQGVFIKQHAALGHDVLALVVSVDGENLVGNAVQVQLCHFLLTLLSCHAVTVLTLQAHTS